MALLPNSKRKKNLLLAHTLVALFLLILSIVFFGMSSITAGYMYGGIVLMILAAIDMTLYFVREKGVCDCSMTLCFCKGCCDTCCLNSRRQSELRAQQVALAIRSSSMFVEVPSTLPPDDIQRLRRMERKILEMVQRLSSLEDSLTQSSEERNFAELLRWYLETENKTLSRWLEGQNTYSSGDIERMERRIEQMQQRWHLQDQDSLRDILLDPSAQRWYTNYCILNLSSLQSYAKQFLVFLSIKP